MGVLVGGEVGVMVGLGVAVKVGRGVGGRGVFVLAGVEVGATVTVGGLVAVLIAVGLGGRGVLDTIIIGDCSSGRCTVRVAPVFGTKTTTVPVAVPGKVPNEMTAGNADFVAVDAGVGVPIGRTASESVGVKKRWAKASRVRARSRGVAVAVNLAVSTISGRVSSLSPAITNGM
jgi:hypothetical protein